MADKFNEEMNEEMENNIIELIDEESGEAVPFEHLDTIDMDGVTYFVLTEFKDFFKSLSFIEVINLPSSS